MKRIRWAQVAFAAVATLAPCCAPNAAAQTTPAAAYWRQLFNRPASAPRVPGPEHLNDYIAAGKLRLSLSDAVHLAIFNDSDVRINRLQVDLAGYSLLRAYQPFDPVLTGSFQPTRSTTPATSQLQGAETLSDLTQTTTIAYTQKFQTGTSYSVGFSNTRDSNNNSYNFINPSFNSSLNFSFTQPLLRGRGFATNRAPLTIARRTLKQSRSNFEARLNDTASKVINQYWDVVQSRQNLEVLQKSLELAEATYKQNKRSLELGALPPLDIYRSESQVAQRKLALVQAQYRLRQLEDTLRLSIGADLDPTVQALPLDLTERADNVAIRPVDLKQSTERAFAHRPEMEALRLQMANDDTSIESANQNLKPDLNLTGFYTSSGNGGNVFDTNTGALISRGGFGDAMSQLGNFNYPTYGVSLELRLPLRNRAAAADLGTALTGRKRTLYQARQQQQSISLEVRNALNQLEGSALAVEAAKVALELARKNLAAEQRKYELGAQTIFFVLDAQTQLASAEQDLVTTQINYSRALASLDHATGDLLEHSGIKVADVR